MLHGNPINEGHTADGRAIHPLLAGVRIGS